MPARGSGAWKRDTTWWTRERVIEGLRRFYADKGEAPTDTGVYHEMVRFHVADRQAWRRRYPSTASVGRYFATMVDAWTEAEIPCQPKQWPDWTPEEDALLIEGCGILKRDELAELIGRSPVAVHSRLSTLGVHTYRAHGWTAHRLERATQLPSAVFEWYRDRGLLAFFRGTKCAYFDPADLATIEEIDWTGSGRGATAPPELLHDVERALRARLVRQLAAHAGGTDWRAGSLYKAEAIPWTRFRPGARKRLVGRVTLPPKPIEIERGDWVRCVRPVPNRDGVVGRLGLVHLVYCSLTRQVKGTARTTPEPTWMARVEFKKERRHGNDRPRVKYSLPLSCLEWAGPRAGEQEAL